MNSYLGNRAQQLRALPYTYSKHADSAIETASDKTTRREQSQIVPEVSLQMKSAGFRVAASSLCVQLRPVFVLLQADPLKHIIMLNRLPTTSLSAHHFRCFKDLFVQSISNPQQECL